MMEWLENFVKSLVQEPDAVSVSQEEGVMVRVVNLKVATQDLNLFEGRNNRLVRAMGSFLSLAGAKPRIRYVLKVAD